MVPDAQQIVHVPVATSLARAVVRVMRQQRMLTAEQAVAPTARLTVLPAVLTVATKEKP